MILLIINSVRRHNPYCLNQFTKHIVLNSEKNLSIHFNAANNLFIYFN